VLLHCISELLVGESTDHKILPDKGSRSGEYLLAAALVIIIIIGMAAKLVQTIGLTLNSDMANIGLEAMEIGKYHNYLLSGFYAPASDTFYFTDLVPFHLVPQILTNYDPLTLKVVTFIIFALTVAAFAYLVFLVSGSRYSALVFAALAACIPAEGYWYFAHPEAHIGTMFFGAITLILLLRMSQKAGPLLVKNPNKRAAKEEQAKLPWPYLIAISALAFFTAISDTIVIIWFFIPCFLVYLLFVKNKTRATSLAFIAMLVFSATAYLVKTYGPMGLYHQVLGIYSPAQVLQITLPLFIKASTLLLNQGLFALSGGVGNWGLMELLSAILFAGVVLYAVARPGPGVKTPATYAIVASICVIFPFFLFSDYVVDIGAARYLIFPALGVIGFVALSFKEQDKINVALVLGLLVLSTAGNLLYLSSTHFDPNAEDYGLIGYLEGQGLTYGFGTYWNANLFTYLSGEDVTVRSVRFNENGMQANMWLSCTRWYEAKPSKGFLLVENGTTDKDQDVSAIMQKYNLSAPLRYGKYDIYTYDFQAGA
jgi:hypothetical protein